MKCLIMFCLCGVTLGAVFESLPSTNPEFPGQCWLDDLKVAVKPGETYSKIGDCTEYRCNGDLSYSGQNCGIMITNRLGCNVVSDNTLKYPDCCPKVACS